jgi:hypothetical protein
MPGPYSVKIKREAGKGGGSSGHIVRSGGATLTQINVAHGYRMAGLEHAILI